MGASLAHTVNQGSGDDIVTRMITIMAVLCHWALYPVTHKRTLEMLIISHVQTSVSLN